MSHPVSGHTVVFTPVGIRLEVPRGSTLLDAARVAGIDLDSVCGGRGLCGRCQVTPTTGRLAKWGIDSRASALSEAGPTELAYRGRRPLVEANRLGCQARVLGDVVVDVPAESQVHRPVVRKAVDLGGIVVDPVVTLHHVLVERPQLGDEMPEDELLRRALAREWGLDVEIGIEVLADLHPAATEGQRAVTAVVHSGRRVLAVRPGYSETAYGVAVDIGSTTVAGYLADLASGEVVATAGRMNPQIRFGEDLMSRVSYVMMNPGGDRELTEAIRTAIGELVDELVVLAGVDRRHVHDLVLVGNPIMHHLVLGLDPSPLGVAPFTLATSGAVRGSARDIGLDLPGTTLYVGPCIAGHVGADAAAATLAAGPQHHDAPGLLVDVGTNAEIVLGAHGKLWAASSPTGPAFEGAQISCGQRATAGAIERVRIDPESLEARYRVIGCDLWSDDPGFDEALGSIEVSGICGSGIVEVVAEMFLTGVIDSDGVVDGTQAARSRRVVPDGRTHRYVLRSGPPEIAVTQNDIRAIQLAKAALRAGIDLLAEHAGVESLAEVRLAGAFGNHINPLHALVLGLVPDCPVDAVASVGNASGTGALRMLLSGSERRQVEALVSDITRIETAVEPRFQELFVDAMAFPHRTSAHPFLAAAVALPPPRVVAADGRSRRRRRQEVER